MSKNKGNILIPVLVASLLIAIAIAGYFYWQNQQLQTQPISESTSATVTPKVTQISPVVSSDETKDWKTYKNTKFSFEFSYPGNLKENILENNQTSFDQFVVSLREDEKKTSSQDFTLDVNVNKSQENLSNYYLGSEPSGTVSSNSIVWSILKFPQGYSDAGMVGNSFIAYQTNKGNQRYVLMFYGNSEPNPYQNQILSTFVFVN